MLHSYKFTNNKGEISRYTWICDDCREKVQSEGIELVDEITALTGICYCCERARVLVTKWEIRDSFNFNFNFNF